MSAIDRFALSRIIPARAGFTAARKAIGATYVDHPRSRGVYPRPQPPDSYQRGSSPLARGLRRPVVAVQGAAGIIPARAGFTGRQHPEMGDQPDHPRSRGVYRFDSLCASAKSGSSPLARGLQEDHGVVALLHRIIPARAGFTSTCRARRARSPDHPRSRGVYPPSGVMASSGQGSSPLARGLPSRLAGRIGSRGIIPARAGFTDAALLAHHVTPDHPRSRGVYASRSLGRSATSGSSPLARGLPLGEGRPLLEERIIPARAGFTLADPWNPNDEPHYQTAFAFTADLVLAPQSSDSAVVSQRSTRTPSEA